MHLMATSLCCCVDEDRNFAHYNFVNEQNNEAQALRDRISQVSMSLFFTVHMIVTPFLLFTCFFYSHSANNTMFMSPRSLDLIKKSQPKLSTDNDAGYGGVNWEFSSLIFLLFCQC